MITVIKGETRGTTQLDWLDSKHTFSFADYYNPSMMRFGPLRVINEDWIAPGQGFGAHPHRDMEIITYICEGALQHRDSMGSGEVITAGEVQHMTAGSGVVHSEFNASPTTPVHLFQIWIMPREKNLRPGYAQQKVEWRQNAWTLLAAPSGTPDKAPLKIHQDVELYGGRIDGGQTLRYFGKRGGMWLQIARGEARIGEQIVTAGDGIAISEEASVEIVALQDTEVLLFDVPIGS